MKILINGVADGHPNCGIIDLNKKINYDCDYNELIELIKNNIKKKEFSIEAPFHLQAVVFDHEEKIPFEGKICYSINIYFC